MTEFKNLEERVVGVVDKVIPSVVSVSVTKLTRVNLSQVAPVQGQGSGVILSEDGYIVTNAHVVAGFSDVEVTLNDGRTFKARIMGLSKARDIAILKIEADDLVPIKMSECTSLRMGQFAIAVGNPLGLGTTVTFGMVSAIDRTIQSRNTYLEGLVQTSAQINPGNSGGALVDSDGCLIGVPTAMIPWSQGIGFAIAADEVKAAFDELRQTGDIRTPWLGVVGVTLNKAIAAHYRLQIDQGALLLEIPRGPASDVGLRPGDVIISVDGDDVVGMDDLRRKILQKGVGEKLLVRFHRANDVFETYITLGAAP
ncbi:MAG: trypsin-like peptidase domain-containing protein [Candidatus Thorarchaeota archaeon]|nr:MAG: trypsin-like peptidase domain-containing protein [Candidatus Thorarchaeota archaeon]